MKILPVIETTEMPPPTKYGAIQREALELAYQQVLPVEFDSDKECRRAYEAMFHWRSRNRYDDFVIQKRGYVLYIERTA